MFHGKINCKWQFSIATSHFCLPELWSASALVWSHWAKEAGGTGETSKSATRPQLRQGHHPISHWGGSWMTCGMQPQLQQDYKKIAATGFRASKCPDKCDNYIYIYTVYIYIYIHMCSYCFQMFPALSLISIATLRVNGSQIGRRATLSTPP